MGGKPTSKCVRDEKELEKFQPCIMYLKYLQYLTEREKLFTLIRHITWQTHFWQYVSIVVPSFWHVLPPLLSLSRIRMSSMSLPCPTKKMDLLLLSLSFKWRSDIFSSCLIATWLYILFQNYTQTIPSHFTIYNFERRRCYVFFFLV